MASSTLRIGGRRLLGQQQSLGNACRRGFGTSSACRQQQINVSSTSGGIKVASIDENQPTSAITVAIKAGPRYESQPGLANILKNFVFKSTSKRSALRIIRETELLGGVLSASLTREHLFLTAECMRGDEGYFTEILGDVLTSSKFAAHEYSEEVVQSVAGEYQLAQANAEVSALDLAHQLAFRKGLGNSLFASPHSEVALLSAVSYARSAFSSPSGIAVLASGGSAGNFKDLVSELFTSSSAASSKSAEGAVASSSPSKYFGGEIRVASTGHNSNGTLLVAFEGGAHDAAAYAVLRTLLGGESSVKWSKGLAPLSQLSSVVGSTVKSFNLHYSDAGLLGFIIQAPTNEVSGIAQKSIEALKAVANGVKDEDIKRAIAKTKLQAALAQESRIGKQEILGAQLLESGKVTSLADAFSTTDKVTASQVQEAAKKALKSKATVVAIGDIHKLPFSDELGL